MKHIFIVDDNHDDLLFMTMALERAGYKVRQFDNAAAAIESIPQFKPDIYVTDVSLPEVDGAESLRKIKKLYPQLPVIAVSAYRQYLNNMEDLGAAAVCCKSLDHANLLSAIKKVESD